jgi:hypothetical protein
MKTTLVSFILLCIFSLTSYAQGPYSIKGIVIDTASTLKLVNTSISVLRAKDSTLVKFTRANENGVFTINNLPKGKLFILVTYPGYADYVAPFNLDSSKTVVDFGKINLILKATLLQNVIIKGKAVPIKIKGDTTEFNASSYTIQPNSKVEDLLKQLPGIQVDQDGKITAQGQTVNKVLVDGEEFFGDDPTLVTKNIRGDMVDKVQLYDKKSDQATFTGIDDGTKEKTLNIKLKEDKKNGYFGKLDVGGATEGFYQAQGMFNMFKGKKKFSLYGTLGNTGKTGLGWQDNSKYGSSDNIEMVDGGAAIIFSGGGDGLDSFDGRYDGNGIPLARTGGAHFDNKWNSDKESINANYKIGSLSVEGVRNTLSQNNLPTGIINTTSDQDFDNYIFRQKLDATYEVKLDTTSTLKFAVDGTLKNNETRSSFSTRALSGNDVMLNESTRSLSNDGHDKIFNARIYWTKKLKKQGRTLSLNVTEAINQNDSRGFLKSNNNYYNPDGTLDSNQVIDQLKTSISKSSVVNSTLAYTEPLSKTLSLVLNYGLNINNSSANRESFNKSADGNYSILDSLYSNNFKLDQLANQGGAIFNYKKDKTIINFGTKVSNVRFEQKDLNNNTSLKRNFINWNPQANYQYRFSQQEYVSIQYRGNTTQPSITQIQPLLINTDPLNIILGNPALKPSFNSSISMYYNSYKILSSQSLYIGGSYNFVLNPIINNAVVDAAGKSTSQAINLKDKSTNNFYVYAGASKNIKPVDANIGLSLNVNGNTTYGYINNALNQSQAYSYSGNISVSKYKQKKYESRISLGPTYTTNESSLQQQVNDNGWGLNGYGSFAVYLPAKFEIGSDASYEYRAATQSFDTDFKRLLWNARISKKFLKSEGLKFSLSVNDLLNQNVGFNRSAYGSMITQNSYTTIKRYFMASIVWDFNKMGGSDAKK